MVRNRRNHDSCRPIFRFGILDINPHLSAGGGIGNLKSIQVSPDFFLNRATRCEGRLDEVVKRLYIQLFYYCIPICNRFLSNLNGIIF
jgi:hypothetical protein